MVCEGWSMSPRQQPVPANSQPQPDPDQMAADTWLTSFVAGGTFLVATIIFGVFGGVGISLARALGGNRILQMVLVAVGFAMATGLIAVGVRRFRPQIERRGPAWYRGIIIGTAISLGIIVLMYFFPHIVFPKYCPPGGLCE